MNTQRTRVRGLTLYGLAGSLLILLCSFGVGWLTIDSPLNRWLPVIALRTEAAGVVVSTVGLTLGCWMLFHAWLRLYLQLRTSQEWTPGALKVVTRAALLWSAPQLLAAPIFSRDVFAYLNQGRLVLMGEDPYQVGVSQLENWFQLGTDVTWAENETPYGPVFLWIAAGIMQLSGAHHDLAVLLFRVVCAAGVVMLMIWVPKLASHCGTEPAYAQWLTVANPLLIISFVSSAHNDALMMGCALAGIWAALQGRGVLAAVLVALSIGIKPITLLLLPFVGLLWAAHRGDLPLTWRRRVVYWAGTAGVSGALLLIVGVIQGYGFGWVGVMSGTGDGHVLWAPVGLLHGLISVVLMPFGLDGDWSLELLRTVGRLVSVIVVLVLILRGDDRRILHRMMWAFTAVVVLSPVIQPWYLLWLLPLFAVTGIRPGKPLALVVAVSAFFLAYGAADQLFVYQFIDLQAEMIVVSAVVSVLCLTALAVLDKPVRSIVWEPEEPRRKQERRAR